jgi:hypothetical protein
VRTSTGSPRGHFASGLGQALAVWLAVVLVGLLVPDATVAWVALGAGVLGCLLLGTRHRRRARVDSATGAFTGVVLWPLVIGVALAAISIASLSLSTVE